MEIKRQKQSFKIREKLKQANEKAVFLYNKCKNV